MFTLLIEQDNDQSLLIDEVRRASKKKSTKLNIDVRTPDFQRDNIIFFFRCFFVLARDGITKIWGTIQSLEINLT